MRRSRVVVSEDLRVQRVFEVLNARKLALLEAGTPVEDHHNDRIIQRAEQRLRELGFYDF